MALQQLIPALSIALVLLSLPVYGQINSPCTTSMLTSLTPCLNFITNSSANGTSPTSDCCNMLKTFMTNGTSCFCLIATGSVPFNIPINRTLALSLPRACNQPGVPLQCKGKSTLHLFHVFSNRFKENQCFNFTIFQLKLLQFTKCMFTIF